MLDTMLYDIGDIVWIDERDYMRGLAGAYEVIECLTRARPELLMRPLPETHNRTNVIGHKPPALVRPAKWRIGDKIEYFGGIEDARGIYTVRGVTPSGKAAVEENRDFTLAAPYNGMDVYGIRLVHRPGVTVLHQPTAPTTPCPDCANTDYPGEYVGFTSRGPCPTCHGRCHV